jgi:hypothetical protein
MIIYTYAVLATKYRNSYRYTVMCNCFKNEFPCFMPTEYVFTTEHAARAKAREMQTIQDEYRNRVVQS